MKKIISFVALLSFFSMPVTNCAEKLAELRIKRFEDKKLFITNIIPKTLYSNKERFRYLSKEKLPDGKINYYIPNNCDTPYYKDSILRFKPIKGNCKVISFGVYDVLMKGEFFIPYKQGYFTESNITFEDDSVNVNNIHNQLNIMKIILRDPKTKMTFGISVDAKKLKDSFSLFLEKFEGKKNVPIGKNPSFHLQAVIINYDNNSMYLIYEINGLQHYYGWNLLNLKIMKLFISSINDKSRRDEYLSIFGLENKDNAKLGNDKVNLEKSIDGSSYSVKSLSTKSVSINV